jgi:hypothetical protein
MFRRWILVTLAALALSASAYAQNVNLTETPLDKGAVRIELSLQLEGKISVRQDGKEMTYPHKASARHDYVERVLETSAGVADKAARYYTTAEGTITFNNDEASKRTLRDKVRFQVAQRLPERVVSFNPEIQLTREEAELTEHFNTMAVAGLLPAKEIAVGKTWTVANQVAAALCDLEGLTQQDLEGKLESLKGKIAHISVAGKVQGISLGASVSMLVQAKIEFDTQSQRIVAVEWKETNQRQQGPVTPALTADAVIKLTRTPIEVPEHLNDFALVKVPTTKAPPAELTNIQHVDAKKRFTLMHARDWHVVSPEDNPQLVLRYLEQGKFVAQATVTPWKKIEPAKAMSKEEFAELMAKTPGWMEDKQTECQSLPNLPKAHHSAYRVVATGDLDGVRTVQYFYLIVGVNGEQAIVTFSIDPQQVQRLGARDVEMIREIAFP